MTQKSEKEKIIENVNIVTDGNFHGIECMDNKRDDEWGFEGCYNNDINHPDPRPAHQIWIKKIYAEKLYRLFTRQEIETNNKWLQAVQKLKEELIYHMDDLRDEKDLQILENFIFLIIDKIFGELINQSQQTKPCKSSEVKIIGETRKTAQTLEDKPAETIQIKTGKTYGMSHFGGLVE